MTQGANGESEDVLVKQWTKAWCGLLGVLLLATGCTASTTVTDTAAVEPTAISTAVPDPTSVPDPTAAPEPTVTPIPTTPVPATPAPEPATEPEVTAEPVPAPGELVWSPCAGGECTTVTVPLDYDDPAGPTIEIAVSRALARNTDDRIGPLFVNFGGPGGESSSIFPFASSLLGSSFERFDIVTWDPRGIGQSERLACDDALDDGIQFIEIDPTDGFADEVAQQELEFADVVTCAEASGPITDHLGTANVARDMEEVRLALGGEPMNYLGLSYGTQIGWVYATFFGDSVRSMILDGAVPAGAISAVDFIDQLAAFQRTFTYFDELCDRSGSCSLADEGLAEAAERVAQQLGEEPIDLVGGEVFGETEFRLAVAFAMYQPPQVIGPVLISWIEDAAEGDPSGLNGLLENSSANSTPGAYEAVLCADGGQFPGPAGQAADYEATVAASEMFGTLGEVVRCDLWQGEVELLPDLDSSDAPTILVVGNTFDAATPIESAVLLDEQLADSVLLTVDAGGHTAVLDHPCATEVAVAYLNDLITPPVDTVCFTPGLFGMQLINEDNGVRVDGLLAGSSAEGGGVLVDDLVIEVDGEPVLEVADIPAIRPGTASDWVLLRDGERVELTLTPDARPWN